MYRRNKSRKIHTACKDLQKKSLISATILQKKQQQQKLTKLAWCSLVDN